MGNFGIKIITETDAFHTSELGLKMTALKIPFPSPKTNYISVPGASGNIDLSEVFGRVLYEDRSNVTFEFVLRGNFDLWEVVTFRIATMIHGKKCKVIVDNDLSHYYVCRLSVDRSKSKRSVGTITLSGTAESFKYDIYNTAEEWLWDTFDFEEGVLREYNEITVSENNKELVLIGGIMPQVPVFTVKNVNELKLTYAGRTYDMPEDGTYRFPAIVVAENDITLSFTGTGIVTINYRGAYL